MPAPSRRRCPQVPVGRSVRRSRGAAVVDFVFVMLLLVPLFLAIFQVGLTLYVRNTLAACASEGARYGAFFDRAPADGVARARTCVSGALPGYPVELGVGTDGAGGQPLVVVTAHTDVPALGLWGRVVAVTVRGHAVKETA